MQRRARLPLLARAVAIGLIAPVPLFIGRILQGYVQLGPDAGFGYLFFGSVAAAPFVVLALSGVRARAAWFAGGAATALIWTFLFVGMVLERPVNSVELGLGVAAVLLLSPFFVGGVMGAAAALTALNARARREYP